MGIREARQTLGERVNAAHYLGEYTVIERNGTPFAVLVPHAWWAEQHGVQDGSGLTPH